MFSNTSTYNQNQETRLPLLCEVAGPGVVRGRAYGHGWRGEGGRGGGQGRDCHDDGGGVVLPAHKEYEVPTAAGRQHQCQGPEHSEDKQNCSLCITCLENSKHLRTSPSLRPQGKHVLVRILVLIIYFFLL